MRDHAHLVIPRHRYSIEQVGNLFKGAATRQMTAQHRHPFTDSPYADGSLPSPWARKQWAVYLFDVADITHAVNYVNDNPLKQNMPQNWSFITV